MTQDTNVEFTFYVASDYTDLTTNATDVDGIYLDASTTSAPEPGDNWTSGDIYHFPDGLASSPSIWLGPRPHPKVV